MKGRVLITGIAGFIGSNLSRGLLDRGYEVDGIDDLSVGQEKHVDPRVNMFHVRKVSDIISEPWAQHYDTIVHLATKKIPRYGGATSVLVDNTRGIEAVVRFAKRTGAKVIFASTSDCYGKQSEFHENADSIIGPSDISRWSYAISKLWCEQYLYAQTEVDFNIIRYFGSYGPYMALSWTAGPPSVFISQALKGEPLTVHGTGEQTRCFSYIDDHVDGTIKLMESGMNREVFNFGNPDVEISMENFAYRVLWIVHGYGGDKSYEVSDGDFMIPLVPQMKPPINFVPYTNIKYEDVMRRVPNIEKARCFLDYQPTIGLDEGLRRTIEWQRKEMGL